MGTSGMCNLQVAGCRQRSECATMWLPMTTVRREIVLPVDPDRAWELITDPDELEGWLAEEVELDPEEGGEVRVEWEDGDSREGVVEEVEEGRRLAFVWGEEPSRVEWTLDPPCPAAPASSSSSAASRPSSARAWRRSRRTPRCAWPERARARRAVRRARRPHAPPGRPLARPRAGRDRLRASPASCR